MFRKIGGVKYPGNKYSLRVAQKQWHAFLHGAPRERFEILHRFKPNFPENILLMPM